MRSLIILIITFFYSLFQVKPVLVKANNYLNQLANALIFSSTNNKSLLYENKLKCRFYEVPSLISAWIDYCSELAFIDEEYNVDNIEALAFVKSYFRQHSIIL